MTAPPGVRSMTRFEASAEGELPDPSALVALAFLAPWGVASAFLPSPYRLWSLGLVALLAVLLLAAAAWSFRTARERSLDAPHWAFVTVVTLGLAMLVLAFTRAHAHDAGTFVCMECGREAPMVETFCYRCGAA